MPNQDDFVLARHSLANDGHIAAPARLGCQPRLRTVVACHARPSMGSSMVMVKQAPASHATPVTCEAIIVLLMHVGCCLRASSVRPDVLLAAQRLRSRLLDRGP